MPADSIIGLHLFVVFGALKFHDDGKKTTLGIFMPCWFFVKTRIFFQVTLVNSPLFYYSGKSTVRYISTKRPQSHEK